MSTKLHLHSANLVAPAVYAAKASLLLLSLLCKQFDALLNAFRATAAISTDQLHKPSYLLPAAACKAPAMHPLP
jgi:hypothetical protein